MNDRCDDRALVQACLAGQTDAFGVLVERYQDRLYPTLLRLTGRPEDALDLLQEAFLRSYEKLDRFQGGSSFYTWVYRIAVNLALSDRRKQKVIRRIFALPGLATEMEPADDPGQTDPSRPVLRAEQSVQVQTALDALDPRHRAVLIMADQDELRYEQIAEILGVPVGTVRSRLHRARSELRDRLRGLLDTEPSRPEPQTSQAPIASLEPG